MNKLTIALIFCAVFVMAESKNFLAKEETDTTFFTEFDDDLEEHLLSHYLGLDDGNEEDDDDGLDEFSIERRLLIPESNEATLDNDDESVLLMEEDSGCGDETEADLPAKGSCITVTHCYLTDIPRIGKKPIYKTKVVCN